MLPDNDRINNASLFFVLTAVIIEFGILAAPRTFAKEAGNDSWLAILILFIPVMGTCFLITRLTQLFPGENFLEYSQKIVGRWVGILLCFILAGYWLINNGRIVRSLAEIIRVFLLFRTPIEVIMITFLIVSAYLARGGIEAIARYCTLAVLISVPIGLLLVLFTYTDWDFGNLLPILEKGWKPVLVTGFKSLGLIEGLESILVLMALVRKPQKAMPYCIGALFLALSILFFVNFACLLDFGAKETSRLLIPGISLIQSVELPGRFLERLGSIYVTVWIIILFPTTVAFLYLPGMALAQAFKLNEVYPLIYGFIPIIYVIALLPQNEIQFFQFAEKMSIINIGVILGLPLVLYITARLRGFKPGGNRN